MNECAVSTLPSDCVFHHIGYATHSIQGEQSFLYALGYEIEGECFEDPSQGIFGCFMVGSGPRIELLENLEGSQTLTPWLNAGIKMYHFAYLVNSLDQAIDWTITQRARIITKPTPAVAFGRRNIAFVMLRNKLLVEFIQAK